MARADELFEGVQRRYEAVSPLLDVARRPVDADNDAERATTVRVEREIDDLLSEARQNNAELTEVDALIERVVDVLVRWERTWEARPWNERQPQAEMLVDLKGPSTTDDLHAMDQSLIHLTRNLSAMRYYDILASMHGHAYAPHLSRRVASVLYPGSITAHQSLRNLPLLRASEARRKHLEARIDLPADMRSFHLDMSVPMVLAHVLRDAAGPIEAVERALALRESKGARRFRRRALEAEAALYSGSSSVVDVRRALRRASRDFASLLPDTERVEVGLSLGLFSVATAAKDAMRWILPRRRLTDRISHSATRITRLDDHLAGVLGEQAAQSWRVMRRLASTQANEEGVDYAVVDLRSCHAVSLARFADTEFQPTWVSLIEDRLGLSEGELVQRVGLSPQLDALRALYVSSRDRPNLDDLKTAERAASSDDG